MQITETKEYKPIIELMYKMDDSFVNEYYSTGYGLEYCVESTCEAMENMYDPHFFVIHNDSDILGYFCKDSIDNKDFISTFFINPNFRKNKKEIFDIICNEFDNTITVCLFIKNIRAIKFFMNYGFTVKDVYSSHIELQLKR